jgi:Protein of unknown function (DUF3828)
MRAIRSRLSGAGIGWEMRFAAVLLFVFVGCSRATNDELEAKKAATAFYDVYMKIRPSGVPTKEQQAEFKQVLSTRLAALLSQASAVEETSSPERESGTPPRIEGDLFTSLDQGAVSYKVLECKSQNQVVTCDVELANIDDRDNSKFTWKDRVFVVREGNRWVVDDIEYVGDRPFMHKGHLKEVLSKVMEEAKKEAR